MTQKKINEHVLYGIDATIEAIIKKYSLSDSYPSLVLLKDILDNALMDMDNPKNKRLLFLVLSLYQLGRTRRPAKVSGLPEPWNSLAISKGGAATLANIFGVSRSTVHRWAKGEVKMLKVYQRHVQEVFDESGILYRV